VIIVSYRQSVMVVLSVLLCISVFTDALFILFSPLGDRIGFCPENILV